MTKVSESTTEKSTKAVIIIHFGRNPVNGGRPPNENSEIKSETWVSFGSDLVLDREETLKSFNVIRIEIRIVE